MCLYPTWGINPKYKPNKKNGGNPPKCEDGRLLYVPFKCGKCIECRKQKQREWRVRLAEELKDNFAYFVTLTISDQGLQYLEKRTGLRIEGNPNEIATYAVRLFCERVRAATGKSMRHWFTTELGEDTDRIHLHGLTFGQNTAKLLRKHWTFGGIFIGTFTNERSINYMTKYMLKVDLKHPTYTPVVLASKGIGKGYIKRGGGKWQKDNYKKITVPSYTFRNGTKMSMPKYYKDKLFSDEERETMWLNNLERGYEYIGGEKVRADDTQTIENLRKFYRRKGVNIFHDNPDAWDEAKARRRMEKQRKAIAIRKRLASKAATGRQAWADKDIRKLYTEMVKVFNENERKYLAQVGPRSRRRGGSSTA